PGTRPSERAQRPRRRRRSLPRRRPSMPDLDERLITGETVVRSTSKHWIAPLGDSVWAILMIVGALIAAWLQGDSTTGVAGFFNRGLELVRLALFLGGIAWIV